MALVLSGCSCNCSTAFRGLQVERRVDQRAATQARPLPSPHASQGAPKQGRGNSSRKAAADGIRQRRMKADFQAYDGWKQVSSREELVAGSNKALIIDNKGFVLVQRGEDVVAIGSSCPSCKFPMIEGKVVSGAEDRSSIGCPLCHSEFSLEDGEVLQHCPKDGPLQWVIGTLKEKATPERLKIFPSRVSTAGKVYIRL